MYETATNLLRHNCCNYKSLMFEEQSLTSSIVVCVFDRPAPDDFDDYPRHRGEPPADRM